jgi:competence ComEA-like helix-hairpin-helix protein
MNLANAMRSKIIRMVAWMLCIGAIATACEQGPPAEGSIRVNVNTCTLTELETVPGIGEALAKVIVAGRPYQSVDQLLDVKGIGEKSLEKLRPYVKVDGETEKLR